MQVKCPFVSPHCTLKTLGITAICSKWFDPYATLFIFLELTYRYRQPLSHLSPGSGHQGWRAVAQWVGNRQECGTPGTHCSHTWSHGLRITGGIRFYGCKFFQKVSVNVYANFCFTGTNKATGKYLYLVNKLMRKFTLCNKFNNKQIGKNLLLWNLKKILN